MDVAFSLVMDQRLADQVEQFREREGLSVRAEAARKLIRVGLKAEGIE